MCAVGSGQGRDGGGSKMAKLYYHQLTEKVVSVAGRCVLKKNVVFDVLLLAACESLDWKR